MATKKRQSIPEEAAARGIKAIAESMKIDEENMKLQRKACEGIERILQSLTTMRPGHDEYSVDDHGQGGSGSGSGSGSGKGKFKLDDDSLQTVLDTMAKNPTDQIIQRTGCKIIDSLAKVGMTNAIVRYGGIGILELVLVFHNTSRSPKDIIQASMQALYTMLIMQYPGYSSKSWNSTIRRAVEEAGLLDTLTATTEERKDSVEIQRLGNALMQKISNQQQREQHQRSVKSSTVNDNEENDDDNNNDGNESDDFSMASSTEGEERSRLYKTSLIDPYGDRGTYTGVILRSTQMPHGRGRMIYDDDRTYDGDWRHGRWNGYGRAAFSNGDVYEGEYKFDQRHGRGVYTWEDRRVYEGEFRDDQRNGRGIFRWPDGAIYDGEFVNGQREGHGKYTFAEGGQYEGSWIDGRYDGYGSCIWHDGRSYHGGWKNGMAHGQGVEMNPDGSIYHEGEWNEDEPVRS